MESRPAGLSLAAQPALLAKAVSLIFSLGVMSPPSGSAGQKLKASMNWNAVRSSSVRATSKRNWWSEMLTCAPMP